MSAYLLDKARRGDQARDELRTSYELHPRPKTFTVVPYQSTHNTGGTMMGDDPKSSVVNRYLQSWDAHNLFIQGASVFPQQHGYNPTGIRWARLPTCRPRQSHAKTISSIQDRWFTPEREPAAKGKEKCEK